MTRVATPGVARPDGARWRAPVLVFAVALLLRLAHVWALRRSPYFTHPVLDAETYYRAALAVVTGEGYPDRVFWQPPGYPYFLALLYALAGPGFLVPRVVQAVLGALAAVLTWAIGTRCFGPRVGLGAGLGAAGYGTLIYFDGELLAPSLAVLLQLVAVWCAVRATREMGSMTWFAAGVFGGLTAVVNATALVLVPVMAAFARRRGAWVLLGAAIAIAPVTLRNWGQGREPVLISSNAGINLFLGNNPRYDAAVAMRPGRDWQALLRAPRQHGVQGAAAASRFFVRRVVDWARRDPGAFLRLQVKKVSLLAGGSEIPRNQEIYPARAYSPVLRVLLWNVPGAAVPYGVVFPLAAIGVGVGWRRAPLLATMLLLLAAGVVAFFVTARYRAPLVPLLLVFAAEAVRWATTSADRTRRAVAAAVAVALFLVSNLGQRPMPTRMNPDAEFGLAAWMQREGRIEEALALYQEVARENPGSWDAWDGVGRLLEARGRHAEAAEAFRTARAIVPEHVDTLILLANTALAARCFDAAAAYYRKTLELDPRSVLARANLERAQAGRREGASRPGCDPPPPALSAPALSD